MISVSQTYTIRFSRQKYRFSAWTSVNLESGSIGGLQAKIGCEEASESQPCLCVRTYWVSSCFCSLSRRANSFSPICRPDSDISRTANFPFQTTSIRVCVLDIALFYKEQNIFHRFQNIGWVMSSYTYPSNIPEKVLPTDIVSTRYALIGLLYFFFQLLEWYITDCVFYLVGILLRCFRIDTSGY